MYTTTIISQTNEQIVFEVNDVISVDTATLLILDKEIEGVLNTGLGHLTIQVEDILKQIQLPMCLCNIKVVMVDTSIDEYAQTILSLVPTL